MSSEHVVKQGEHLSGIADKYRFRDYRLIWDHPENAELKKLRVNPNVLFPGDRVFIPDRRLKTQRGVTETQHVFRVERPKLMLRIRAEDLYDKPVANTDCELNVDGKGAKLKTDAKGIVERQIQPTAGTGELILHKPDSPVDGVSVPLHIGHLDPVEEPSGQKARLNNLGYFSGPLDKEDDNLFRSGVEEFQCDHGLKVDGKCGPVTQAKLKEAHGC